MREEHKDRSGDAVIPEWTTPYIFGVAILCYGLFALKVINENGIPRSAALAVACILLGLIAVTVAGWSVLGSRGQESPRGSRYFGAPLPLALLGIGLIGVGQMLRLLLVLITKGG